MRKHSKSDRLVDGLLVGAGAVGFGVLALLVATLFVAPFIMLSGWVISVLWGWFMVPTFGLPALSVPAAIGLAMITGKLAGVKSYEKIRSKPTKEALTGAAVDLLSPLMLLLTGWIVHLFM